MNLFRLLPLFLLFASFALPGPGSRAANTAVASHVMQGTNASPSKSKVVYVNDFELEVVRRRADKNSPAGTASDTASGEPSGAASTAPRSPSSSTPAGSSSKTSRSPAIARPADSQTDSSPTDRANALVNAMSESLVRALEKAGYTVRRLRAGEAPPQTGLRVRGVFAEPDEENRIRRLLVGGDSTTPKMLLYVGVDNLARPEQPLYELAKPPSNDGRHGPVITVTSFSPVARFEMDKNPSDEDIKKITTDIVADLNALLNANPMGASR
jgi:Domain of unknown function (DUF4410)